MRSKFKPGDRVRFSGRVPGYVKAECRSRSRRVKALRYAPDLQATLYELGGNYRGLELCHLFRSYELCKVTLCKVKLGRPRTRRSYRPKSDSKVPALSYSEQGIASTAKGTALPLPLTVSRHSGQVEATDIEGR